MSREAAERRLNLFGGPYVVGPHGPVHLSPTQLAVLAMVGGDAQVDRPKVASVIWRSEPDPPARRRIRQLLYKINARLGGRGLVAVGDHLRLSASLACDLEEFDQALDRGQLRDAGRLAALGFASRELGIGSLEYLDWAARRRGELEKRLRVAARAKWSAARTAHDWEAAGDGAEALYLLDPSSESVVVNLIEARARLGRPGAAEAAYGIYCEVLGSEPSPNSPVSKAIEKARKLHSDRGIRGARVLGPFVGRLDALKEGRSALTRVEDGGFAFFLAKGESGIGKTRLLQELAKDAVMRDIRCLYASPVELEQTIPLNSILDAVRKLDLRPHLQKLDRPWNTVIASNLPPGTCDDFASEIPPIQESRLSRRLLDAFSLLLKSLADECPTILFLDDLQWADATTVRAMQFFQRRWTDGPFGIFASVRPELVRPGSPAAKYLHGEDGLEVISVLLEELSQDEALELIRGLAERPLGPAEAMRLCALAGAHPLYLTELTREWNSGEEYSADVPTGLVTVPLSITQILSSRLEKLGDSAVNLASTLAVSGRGIPLSCLPALTGLAPTICSEHIEELDRNRLVSVTGDRVRLSHELFRSALYARLSPSRRAMLHLAVGRQLDNGDSANLAAELAMHFSHGGERERAATYAWVAAVDAHERGAMPEAAYYYEIVSLSEHDEDRRASATLALATVLHLSRDLKRASPALETAASQLRAVNRLPEARLAEVLRVETLAATGHVPDAELASRLRALEDEGEASHDWESAALALDLQLRLLNRAADLDGIAGVFHRFERIAEADCCKAAVVCQAGLAMKVLFGDVQEGVTAARNAVEMAARHGEYRLTALIRFLVAGQYTGLVFASEFQDGLEEARVLARRAGDLWAQFVIESNFALALLDAGEVDRAEGVLDKVTGLFNTLDRDLPRFNYAMTRAECFLTCEEFVLARQWFEEAESQVRPTTPAYVRDTVNAGIGICALSQGDLTEARKREQALRPRPEYWFYDPTIIVAFQCRLADSRGQYRAAIQDVRKARDAVAERHVMAWFKLNGLLARLLIKHGDPRASQCAQAALSRARDLGLERRAEEAARFAARAKSGLP